MQPGPFGDALAPPPPEPPHHIAPSSRRREDANPSLKLAARIVAVVIACVAFLGGLPDLAEASGRAVGVVLVPLIVAALVGLKWKRAAYITFIVLASVTLLGEMSRRALGAAENQRIDVLIAPTGADNLATPAGECLVETMRGYDEQTLDELERTSGIPAAGAADVLASSVVDCDVDRAIAADTALSFSDSGISGDVVDLECLEAGVSDPGAALYLTIGNASLLTPSTESATPAAALFESVWAGCVRAGRWFADSVSDGGGPSLGSSATDCLDRWFDQDDRFARYLSERLDEFDDGLYSCLDVDEYEAFWAWVESV